MLVYPLNQSIQLAGLYPTGTVNLGGSSWFIGVLCYGTQHTGLVYAGVVGDRSHALGFSEVLARSHTLGFFPVLARSGTMGFSAFLAR